MDDEKTVSFSILAGITFALGFILIDKKLPDEEKAKRLKTALELNPNQKDAKEAALSLLEEYNNNRKNKGRRGKRSVLTK